jgi:hypothetical protein
MEVIANYGNRTTYSFEGVETYPCGKEEVIQQTIITSTADCWPELFTKFVFGLRGAGYVPNREGFEDVLDELFPSDSECDGGCLLYS